MQADMQWCCIILVNVVEPASQWISFFWVDRLVSTSLPTERAFLPIASGRRLILGRVYPIGASCACERYDVLIRNILSMDIRHIYSDEEIWRHQRDVHGPTECE